MCLHLVTLLISWLFYYCSRQLVTKIQKQSMLQTWDFVDPKLAKKLKQLHQQIQQLKKKRTLIISNPRISQSSRQNLLTYNDKCINDLMQLYHIQKDKMTDYFDTQVHVLTKKQVGVHQGQKWKNQELENTKTNTSVKIKNSLEAMGLQLRENEENQQSFQKYRKGSRNGKKKIKIGQSFEDIDNSVENGYKLQYLDTTGRFTNKTMKYQRERAIRSFELATTNRNQSYSYQHQNQSSSQFQITKNYKNQLQNSEHNKNYPKARISYKRYNRLKNRLSSIELQLQLQRLSHKQTAQQLKILDRQSKQDKQLIQLLYTKISLIEAENKNRIAEERKKIQSKFQEELEDLRQKYIDLSNLQEKNKELMAKRKELLKIGNSL